MPASNSKTKENTPQKWRIFFGSEMWSKIYSHPKVQEIPDLRSLLNETGNFEIAHDRVRSNEALFAVYQEFLQDVYAQLHHEICRWNYDGRPDAPNVYGWKPFFMDVIKESQYYFTLNQDIFVEKQYNCRNYLVKEHFCNTMESKQHFNGSRINTADAIRLPTEAAIMPEKEEAVKYVKLHGSYGWLSSNEGNAMVIGLNKIEHINSESLLKKYFQIFSREVLQLQKLLIIGYSFADMHINVILRQGVENGLRLYILQPSRKEPSSKIWVMNSGKKVSTDFSPIL